MRKIGTAVGRTAWFGAALLGSTFVLTACGGGGADTPAASTPQSDNTTQQAVILKATDYRAAQVNDHLVYSHMGTYAPEPDVSTTLNKELKTVDGVEGLIVETHWNGSTGQQFDVLGPDGWITNIDANLTVAKFHKIKNLPATFQIGDTFIMGDEDHSSGKDGPHFHADAAINGFETITTPAGTFQNCIKVSVVETNLWTSTDQDGKPQTQTVKQAYAIWYAPGIGPVFSVDINTDTQVSKPSRQLVAYQINGMRNENIRPVATLKSSPDDSNHGQFSEVTLQFNEPMQGMTLNDKTAVITDPQGHVIPGKVSFTDTTWTFRPDYPSLQVSGLYQLQLTDLATDQAGNSVMPATWTFSADVTPPQLVKTDFVDGQIILTFDEEFAAMPELNRIILFSNTDEGTFLFEVNKSQFSIESNRITLGTKGGHMELKYGAPYHVLIDNNSVGLIDLANNFTPRDIATITIPAGPY